MSEVPWDTALALTLLVSRAPRISGAELLENPNQERTANLSFSCTFSAKPSPSHSLEAE